MEKLRRRLKIFWTEHSGPILFYAMLIGAIILIVQGLNALAIQNNKKRQSESGVNTTNTSNVVNIQEDENNKELINEFIEYCRDGQIEKAYGLLSENCKNNLYPTITDFTNTYYNKMFTKNYDTEVEYYSENIYKITFYQSMLETGQIENRNAVAEDYYKIDAEILEDKVYINYNNTK